MDNKPTEIQAESYVTSKLLQNDFLVTKPTFDKLGADLLIIKEITKKLTSFIKVQSKGRKINSPSTIKIPIAYVDKLFVCFVYLVNDQNNEFLYLFDKNEIEKWPIVKDSYQLYISKKFEESQQFIENLFGNESKLKLENILLTSAVNNLIKVKPTLIIDGVFLRNSIIKTRTNFRDEFQFEQELDIYDLILQLCRYSHIEYNKPFNCYLIESVDLNLKGLINFSEPQSLDDNPELTNEIYSKCNLYITKTNDFVWWKIEELIANILNTDKISFVADDPVYQFLIDELYEKDYEIKLIGDPSKRMTLIDGRFKYAKIEYPILEAYGNHIY